MQQAIYNTALVTCYYGGKNDLRRDATIRAIKEWDGQEYLPHQSVFLELVCPGQEPCFSRPDFPSWLKYVRIYGQSRNRNLFQKEALWNLGAKLTDANKLLFLDNDVEPVGTDDYFSQIFSACIPGRVVHACWHLIHEKQSENFTHYYSVMADKATLPAKSRVFPGLGYCITRQDFDARDGFNPFAIPGSGDAVFLWESCAALNYPMHSAMRFHASLVRRHLPQLEPSTVTGTTLRHNYHGDKTDRGYVWSRELVSLFGHPRAYCHIDSAGLVAWNDPRFLLADMLMQKSRMHTKQELCELVCETVRKRLDEQEELTKTKGADYDTKDFNEFA